jgi:hypothetical protein
MKVKTDIELCLHDIQKDIERVKENIPKLTKRDMFSILSEIKKIDIQITSIYSLLSKTYDDVK